MKNFKKFLFVLPVLLMVFSVVRASSITKITTNGTDDVTFSPIISGTDIKTINSTSLLGSGNMSLLDYVSPGTSGNVLTSNGSVWTSAAPVAGAITLLKANSGSTANITVAPTEFDNVAISGLTAKDTLRIVFSLEATVQGTSGIALTNSTDNVSLTGALGSVIANANAMQEVVCGQMQSASTKVYCIRNGTLANETPDSSGQTATFTTAWTGSWTLSFRSVSATNGGTVKWTWKVYKEAGQ